MTDMTRSRTKASQNVPPLTPRKLFSRICAYARLHGNCFVPDFLRLQARGSVADKLGLLFSVELGLFKRHGSARIALRSIVAVDIVTPCSAFLLELNRAVEAVPIAKAVFRLPTSDLLLVCETRCAPYDQDAADAVDDVFKPLHTLLDHPAMRAAVDRGHGKLNALPDLRGQLA